MPIRLQQFAGTRPAITPRLLPEANATLAIDTRTNNGDLRPLKDVGAVVDTLLTGTIYKHDTHWLSWAGKVDVVPSPIVDDAWDRLYWTGEEEPRYKDSTNMTSTGWRKLGVPRPEAEPTLTLNVGQEDDLGPSDDVTRFYLFTYVTDRGEEGAPSSVSASVVLKRLDDTVTVTMPALAVNDYNVKSVRLYRTATSVSASDWLLVDEVEQVTGAETIYLDEKIDAELLGALTTDSYEMPPTDLRGLSILPNGILAGFVDNTVYLSEAYLPYAWPVYYRHAVEDPVVAIAPIPSGAAILTTGKPYLLMGYSPDSMSLVALDVSEACVSARSAVDMGDFTIYASPDGLVTIGGSGAAIVTYELIEPEQWQSMFDLPNLRAARYERFYLCCDDSLMMIFDPKTGDLRFSAITPHCFYRDAQTDTLWCSMDSGDVRAFDEGGERFIEWQSKLFLTPPTSYSYGLIEFKRLGENYPAVEIYADGKLLFTHTPSSERSIFRIPAVLATEWQVKVSGLVEAVSKLVLAHSSREL